MQKHDHKFDTFIFDLDGTLLDTLPDLVLLTNNILETLGYPTRSEAEILSFVGNGVRRLIQQALPENTPPDMEEKAMYLWNAQFHEAYHHTSPYPEVIDTLKQLRADGCKIGVVSNKLQPGVDVILKICLPGLIDKALGEKPGIPRKPDPTGINEVLHDLNADKQTSVYIGDSPGDIKAAHNAGLFAIAVTWGYHKPIDFEENKSTLPDMFIDSPTELLAFVS